MNDNNDTWKIIAIITINNDFVPALKKTMLMAQRHRHTEARWQIINDNDNIDIIIIIFLSNSYAYFFMI